MYIHTHTGVHTGIAAVAGEGTGGVEGRTGADKKGLQKPAAWCPPCPVAGVGRAGGKAGGKKKAPAARKGQGAGRNYPQYSLR
jgi:hypothetical protein